MSNQVPPPKLESEPEPSVLDYLKSKLSFAPGRTIDLRAWVPARPAPQASVVQSEGGEELKGQTVRAALTVAAWRSLLTLALALFAQILLEPPTRAVAAAVTFYIAAAGLLVWAAWRGEWTLAPHAEALGGTDPLTVGWRPFIAFVVLLIPAFILLGGDHIAPGLPLPPGPVRVLHLQDNLFTWYNVLVWLATIAFFIGSLWLPRSGVPSLWGHIRAFLQHRSWQITISWWTLLILGAVAIVIFYRFYHLQQTPAEPFSDHAEKILDVFDISQGQTHIFFPRNTGREAIQMYWTLLTSWVFGTGLTFLTLKIGTAMLGLLGLPFIYLLGKEVGGWRVGLLACLLAGIGYWPNTISRIGLRFPLYPLFVAPMLLYLLRGLRRRNRNDFIVSGIFLGLGLNGYSPYRIVPFLVIAAFILYMLHAQSRGRRQDTLLWFVIVGLASLLVFLPLLRYATSNPDMFSYRALSRLGSIEQPLPAPWPVVFLSNTWNALRMFNWDDGVIWVHSVPNRPALDIVTGALFLLGILLVVVRYIRERHWLDLFLLISIPILLLPSILSLAFPDENPSLNRTGGAIVPVFIVAALALDGLIRALTSSNGRKLWAYGITGVLLIWSAAQNFDLVFRQFDQNFRNSAWNTSDMGVVIEQFRATYGETDTVWIVPYPFWVDTRLPGIYAGIPNRDFAMQPDDLPNTVKLPGPKLFMVKASLTNPSQNDQKSIDLLKQLYPQGSLGLKRSPIPGHDFWMYFVPVSSGP